MESLQVENNDNDFGAFKNAVYLFSKIRYSLRDIGKIIFLSRVFF
jgi:hypothetical protein